MFSCKLLLSSFSDKFCFNIVKVSGSNCFKELILVTANCS